MIPFIEANQGATLTSLKQQKWYTTSNFRHFSTGNFESGRNVLLFSRLNKKELESTLPLVFQMIPNQSVDGKMFAWVLTLDFETVLLKIDSLELEKLNTCSDEYELREKISKMIGQ